MHIPSLWTIIDEKISMYHSGEYVMSAPPVCHDKWTVHDWINYIDAHGKWTPTKQTIKIFERNRRYTEDVAKWFAENTIPAGTTHNPPGLQRIYDEYNNDMRTLQSRRRKAVEQLTTRQ